jgi:hypothetical protein
VVTRLYIYGVECTLAMKVICIEYRGIYLISQLARKLEEGKHGSVVRVLTCDMLLLLLWDFRFVSKIKLFASKVRGSHQCALVNGVKAW